MNLIIITLIMTEMMMQSNIRVYINIYNLLVELK